MRAALIHQHATTDRDAAIAAALSELANLAESSAPPRPRQHLHAEGRAKRQR